MSAKKTREVILDNSIHIFNEKKPSKVSTVQIADHMDISPGNLYYYFSNKEEIIRCIWKERILTDIHAVFLRHEFIRTSAELVRFYQDAIAHIKEYRFFYSEISTLLNNDQLLYDEMNSSIIRNKHRLFVFVESLINAELVKPLTEEEKIRVSDVMCAVFGKAFYPNYAYSFYGDRETSMDNVLLINVFLTMKPYLTERGWEEMVKELDRQEISFEQNEAILKGQYISA